MVSPSWSAANAPIWELTSGYSSSIRALKPVAVLQAFIDDSASESGDRRFFLAGYVNTADRWIRFSDAWEAELRTKPSIEYLKMREANCLGGQFRNWSTADRNEKLEALSQLIRHFQPRSVHCSVSRSEYERIVQPVAPYGFGMPYYICFSAIMISLANLQLESGGPSVPIDFIFESQEGLGEDAASSIG
jgi:hypothetical protein